MKYPHRITHDLLEIWSSWNGANGPEAVLHWCHRSLTRLGGVADQPTPCENISTTGLHGALLTNGMKVVYVTPELCHRLGTTKRVNPLTTPHVLYGLRRGTLMGLLLIWKLENAELTYWYASTLSADVTWMSLVIANSFVRRIWLELLRTCVQPLDVRAQSTLTGYLHDVKLWWCYVLLPLHTALSWVLVHHCINLLVKLLILYLNVSKTFFFNIAF